MPSKSSSRRGEADRRRVSSSFERNATAPDPVDSSGRVDRCADAQGPFMWAAAASRDVSCGSISDQIGRLHRCPSIGLVLLHELRFCTLRSLTTRSGRPLVFQGYRPTLRQPLPTEALGKGIRVSEKAEHHEVGVIAAQGVCERRCRLDTSSGRPHGIAGDGGNEVIVPSQRPYFSLMDLPCYFNRNPIFLSSARSTRFSW
jgi:hypothetical protein